MNHSDLVNAVASTLGLSRKEADATVAAVLDPIGPALGRGEQVKLNGLGGFEVIERSARSGRNPKTGETIEIAASRSVKFKPAKPLRHAPNPEQA